MFAAHGMQLREIPAYDSPLAPRYAMLVNNRLIMIVLVLVNPSAKPQVPSYHFPHIRPFRVSTRTVGNVTARWISSDRPQRRAIARALAALR